MTRTHPTPSPPGSLLSPAGRPRPGTDDSEGEGSEGEGSEGGLPLAVADVAELHPDHGPLALNAAAALCGMPPRRLDPGFTWADFGCGHGLTVCVQAAALPQGRFFGVDINPQALATGHRLAQLGFLGNARFVEGDVTRLHALDLPPLDFAVLHGLVSWLDVDGRQAAFAGIASLLKPGGLLLVTYDALPGRAALLPLRDLLHSVTSSLEGDPLRRAQAALDWLRRMRRYPVGYFADNPAVTAMVDHLLHLSPLHLARAFFGGTLRPQHFAQIHREITDQGLTFLGRAEEALNVVDLAVPPVAQEVLRAAQTRAEYEALRDFLRNESFRRDLYAKGPPLADDEARTTMLDDLVLGPAEPVGSGDPPLESPPHPGTPVRKRAIPCGAVALDPTSAPLDRLIPRLTTEARSVRSLFDDPDLAQTPPALIREAVRLMLAARLVRPFAQPLAPGPMPSSPSRTDTDEGAPTTPPYWMPHPLNRAFALSLGIGGSRVPLVSPAMGDALMLDNRDALVLLAWCEAGQAAGGHQAAAILERRGLSDATGRWSDSLQQRLDRLMPDALPWLERLGIVTPT